MIEKSFLHRFTLHQTARLLFCDDDNDASEPPSHPTSSCRRYCAATSGTRSTASSSAIRTGRLWRSALCSSSLPCRCWINSTRCSKTSSQSASRAATASSPSLQLSRHRTGVGLLQQLRRTEGFRKQRHMLVAIPGCQNWFFFFFFF